MGKIREFFSKLRNDRRGNALILVASGMPMLIGGAGFAVDTAQWYLWKRELQHAVDQAAYAGAYAMSDELLADEYATRALQEYEANVDKVDGFDSSPAISIRNYAGGDQNSVVVTSTASKTLPFSSFLTGKAATVRATAQASFAAGLSYNACLVSLAEDGTGTSIGGSATVNAKCGIAALSCSEDSIIIDGTATVDTDSIVSCGTVDVDESLDGVTAENVDGLYDAYADLEPPTDDTNRDYACTGKGQNTQASLLPGTYDDITIKCTTTLASGIYVIDGGLLDLSANYNVTGTGVMFVLRGGARLKLGGSGNDNKITLTPPAAADFAGTPYADRADELSDILIFEERDNNPTQSHILNGNSDSVIEGLIYLPDGDLQVNGTADVVAQCLQLTAVTIDIRGGAFLETLCPIDETTDVGESVTKVRMVG